MEEPTTVVVPGGTPRPLWAVKEALRNMYRHRIGACASDCLSCRFEAGQEQSILDELAAMRQQLKDLGG